MMKPVYIWFTQPTSFRELNDDYMKEIAFVSETIEEGEREFVKKYPSFSVEEYTFMTETGEHMYCWAIKREMLVKEKKNDYV